jgi:hypothetical protein
VRQAERKFLVFSSLVGVLMLTSALLLALAPAPLAPDASHTLLAVEAPGAMEAVFDTAVAVDAARWKYIYIHHSQSATDQVEAIAAGEGLNDHFVIGTGLGDADGRVQVSLRWDRQQSAAKPAGLTTMDPGCVSICVVGDFDRALPTTAQVQHLTQLVHALQLRLGITADRVYLDNSQSSPAAVGRYFPTAAFRESLLP